MRICKNTSLNFPWVSPWSFVSEQLSPEIWLVSKEPETQCFKMRPEKSLLKNSLLLAPLLIRMAWVFHTCCSLSLCQFYKILFINLLEQQQKNKKEQERFWNSAVQVPCQKNYAVEASFQLHLDQETFFNSFYSLSTAFLVMMNCFFGIVDQRKTAGIFSSGDLCQRFSPLQISDSPKAGF